MLHLLTVLTVATVLMPAAPDAPFLPASLDLDLIRGCPVQHDGRWPPLDTVARETVEKVTGDVFYQGHDPVLILLAWTFDPQTWQHQPLIRIDNAELRAELQLSATQTVYSYAELVNHQPLRSLIDELAHLDPDHKLNPLESKVSEIHDKLVTLQRVFMGQLIRPIPDPDNVNGLWRPVTGPGVQQTDQTADVESAWADLRKAFLDDDPAAFAKAAKHFTAALAALPAAPRPDAKQIATELRYNRLRPFRTAWMVMVVGALFAAAAMVVRRKWFDVLAAIGMLAGFLVLTYGLSLRWQIAGRIPAANMFESLLFLSWGMGAFAIFAMLVMRNRAVPLMASVMGALALVLADELVTDQYIRPISPALLDTVWMSIHVPIIMVSYSVLAIAMLIAHVQLGVLAIGPNKREWVAAIDAFHYWCIHVGSILLLAGIVTGSMWAAASWGRYWGWDPKEVWSLVAFLGYLAILHVRVDRDRLAWWGYLIGAALLVALFILVVPKLAPITGLKLAAFAGTAAAVVLFVAARGQAATALKSVVCFWLVLMTYLGVNYVLGIGLHSYGFGTGAVARYMLLIGAIDLGVAGLLWVIYFLRRTRANPPTARLAVTR
jgi:ABC-type transport system involved in cytochrome c biogenesis permease subunit